MEILAQPGSEHLLQGITRHSTTSQAHPAWDRAAQNASSTEDDIYGKFTPTRKIFITLTVCYCSFLAPIGSAALLVAVPEIASTFHTTPDMINIANALFFLFMAISPTFWGPLLSVVGRRWIFVVSSVFFTAFTVGTAAAPNLPAFMAFHMLTAFQGTAYLVAGSVVIGDLYPPQERGRALSWMMSGLLLGIILAPLMGGAIITVTSWRVIFWVLAGMSFVDMCMIFFLLPETSHAKADALDGMGPQEVFIALRGLMNPWRVIRPLVLYPNLWISALAASSMMFNQYALLTPIRYVINPHFNIKSPIMSALFFLPPGIGSLLGSFIGGPWSDYIVRRYIRERGRRLAEDRLRAAVWIMAFAVPGCMIIYGWAVEKAVGGIPLVVISMFMQGMFQLFCMPSLNTYCIDVMQENGLSDVAVAGSYLLRYLFSAGASAACLPAIRAIGVGWFSTISSLFISFMAGLIWLLIRHGEKWRTAIDAAEKS